MKRLLVANRGEIAVRVARAAADLGIASVTVLPQADPDASQPHTGPTDQVVTIPGRGPAAYLDVEGTVGAAVRAGCDALHPGYGFLAESPALAEACARSGVVFVGPTPDQLRVLGDKVRARELATRCDVAVLPGTGAVDRAGAHEFAARTPGPLLVKAVAGGGGRGIRPVASVEELDAVWERCRSEAQRAFGDGRLYVEAARSRARHVEVQLVGDGRGRVEHLGERDCSVQRRHQKLIEIAPAPALDPAVRARITDAAVRIAVDIALVGLCTAEFLVDDAGFAFLEANPRVQVEHTVTEELTGVDLVAAQLRLAAGASLDAVLAGRVSDPTGYALQARIGAETLLADGTPVPDTGTVERIELPSGPGVRVDTAASDGYVVDGRFDPLLAKVIVRSRSDDVGLLRDKASRALDAVRVVGVRTNLDLLGALLERPELGTGRMTTRFVDEHLDELVATAGGLPGDPARPSPDTGDVPVVASVGGAVVSVAVRAGERVRAGQELAVLEAMKMEHAVVAPRAGVVAGVETTVGQVFDAGRPLLHLRPEDGTVAEAGGAGPDGGASGGGADHGAPTFDAVPRADLAEVLARKDSLLDAERPDAVERRHGRGMRTARENVAALVDPGTFHEYGGLVVAAQRARRSSDELRRRTPGDGVVTGFGAIGGAAFAPEVSRCLVVAFDETVLAGTMGEMARDKLRRVLDVAERDARPVVLLAEGGGGRAGDTDGKVGVTGWTLDVSCYHQLARISGLAPLVGVVAGTCFAANAGVLACCDVVIATADAHLGVGGPSMISGGGLGRYAVDEIGPMDVQAPNGVVDVVVADEAEATDTARRYLSYFQGDLPSWTCADQTRLRSVVPPNRVRAYDVRDAITLLADDGSVLELRAAFGPGVVTALARVEGRPLGIVANDPRHLGGAIDTDGADKAARFLRLADAFDLPVLMLCDTPGMMVGPDSERSAAVRRMGRLFVTGANLTVPVFTVVLRKAYGIGAELMAAGWFRTPRFTVAWPTGELGGMNIEGNVTLAHRAELDAIADPAARRARFDELVAAMYETGRALSVASHLEVDDVIDPAETRSWIAAAMSTHRPSRPRAAKKHAYVDPW